MYQLDSTKTVEAFGKINCFHEAEGSIRVIYWACGIGGRDTQELGEMNAAQFKNHNLIQPQAPGTGTNLHPAVKYFTVNPINTYAT